MRILIAPDSFKGTLTAREAVAAITEGVSQVLPQAVIQPCPLSDGGEGLAELLLQHYQAEGCTLSVSGPLSETIEAPYGIARYQNTAIMDVASIIGLPMVPRNQRNPFRTHTRGVGELLASLFRENCEHIIIGLGGSATVDGGVGMAAALGYRFLDHKGQNVVPSASSLCDITAIQPPPGPHPWAHRTIRAATDVRNPLTGPHGAARIFGPQKGATPDQVEYLERGLAHLACAVERDLGVSVATTPGGGAAGGLGAGLMAFCGATVEAGIDLVFETFNFEEKVRAADLIITGEGCFDQQSLDGKVVDGVQRIAGQCGKPVGVIAGQIQLPRERWPNPICLGVSMTTDTISLADALQDPVRRLRNAAIRFAQQFQSL